MAYKNAFGAQIKKQSRLALVAYFWLGKFYRFEGIRIG